MSYTRVACKLVYIEKIMPGFVRARIDDDLKNEATAVLAAVGLTVSDAIRMLLTRVAKEKALPFELVVPNAKTMAAMEEGRAISNSKNMRFKTSTEMFRELEEEGGEAAKGKAAARK